MLRTLDVVLIGMMIVAAAFTYQVKQKAEKQVDAIDRLNTQIRLQDETIDLLKADWSVLTQPSRLQRLIADYQNQLHLGTIEPTQIATLNDLPNFPEPKDPPIPTQPGAVPQVVQGGTTIDKILTGSVVH